MPIPSSNPRRTARLANRLLAPAVAFLIVTVAAPTALAQVPLSFFGGWYCDFFRGRYDNSGEFREFNGLERISAYTGGAKYDFANFDVGGREATVNGFGRLTLISRSFDPDNGNKQSSFGLQSFIFGSGVRVPLSDVLSAGARVRMQLDLAADPDPGEFELSDGSHMIGVDFGLRARLESGLGLGLRFYHANQLEENRPSTNAFNIRGAYPVYENDNFAIRAGVNAAYLMGTDDSGHLFGLGLQAGIDLKDSPLSFKLDGGCTEEFIPTAMFGVAGENRNQNRSFSARVKYDLRDRL